jgi:hypothetical protein
MFHFKGKYLKKINRKHVNEWLLFAEIETRKEIYLFFQYLVHINNKIKSGILVVRIKRNKNSKA